MGTTSFHQMKILLVHNKEKDIELFRSTVHKIDSSTEFEYAKIYKDALCKITDPAVRLDVIFLNYDFLKTSVIEILDSLRSTQNSNAVTVLLLSSITAVELDVIASFGVRFFFDRKLFFNQLPRSLRVIINSQAIIKLKGTSDYQS